MIDRAEIERSLTGAGHLFLNRPDAMRFFDTSTGGFWRSFQAIVLVLPTYAVTALASGRFVASGADGEALVSGTGFVIARAMTLGLDWVALPILLAATAGMLGIKGRYPAFIVARNWATVLLILPFAAISLLELIGMASPQIAAFLSLVALMAVFRFSYLVARRALEATIDVAIAIVALDYLVSLLIATVVDRAFGM